MRLPEWTLIASNAAFLIPAAVAWTRLLPVRAYAFFVAAVVSALYHACDTQIYCITDLVVLRDYDWLWSTIAAESAVLLLSTYDHWSSDYIVQGVFVIGTVTAYYWVDRERLVVGGTVASLIWDIITWIWSGDLPGIDAPHVALAAVLTLSAAAVFFSNPGDEYPLMHSLWHVLAAAAASVVFSHWKQPPKPMKVIAPHPRRRHLSAADRGPRGLNPYKLYNH